MQREIDPETKLASRINTGVFIFVMTIIPFFWGDSIPLPALTMATFSIFEGIIHVVGIKIFRRRVPNTPGMVTAEIELVTGIALVVYIAANHIAAWYDYTFAPFVFIAGFIMLQRSLMAMIGMHYSDMLANIKKRFGK